MMLKILVISLITISTSFRWGYTFNSSMAHPDVNRIKLSRDNEILIAKGGNSTSSIVDIIRWQEN